MDAKMKRRIMAGMIALSLVLGIMAVLGSTWQVPDEEIEGMDEGMSLTGKSREMDMGDGAMLSVTMAFSDVCDEGVVEADFDPDNFETGTTQEEVDEACSMATAGMIGSIGMWAGIVCALVITLILVLPMAGVDAMDAIPDIGKKIIGWSAGGLMFLGIIVWKLMLPDLAEMSLGMSAWMGIVAALIGLAAAAIGQFMPAEE